MLAEEFVCWICLKPEDFVFATETGKPLYYRNASARGLDKAADRAGLNPEGVQRLSFHDLRHTAITHLIRSGADAAQVSRFAGHSKVSTTLDLYVGEFDKRKVNDSGQHWPRSTRVGCDRAEGQRTSRYEKRTASSTRTSSS